MPTLRSQLYQCIACDATFDVDGYYRSGYEPGEIEFVPIDGNCPECDCPETEAI